MRVLVACEYSGKVREAFRKLGHSAWSNDLLPSDDNSQFHIQGDCEEVIKLGWDLIVAHPPCTALTVAGNSTYGEGQRKYAERLESAQWTRELWELCKLNAAAVCFENPVGVLPRLGGMPKPSYVQPYQFGHLEQKKTGLFLHNLPALQETDNVYQAMMLLPKRERERLHYLPPSPDRWKVRSETYQGIADAMAAQWGDYITAQTMRAAA